MYMGGYVMEIKKKIELRGEYMVDEKRRGLA